MSMVAQEAAETEPQDNVLTFTAPKKRERRRTARARRILAVGGGKGGIGKSLVSANLGIALAQRGANVVLVDADLGGANLHTCLGVPTPTRTLSDFIEHRVERIEDALLPTGVERLSLLSGAHDMLDAANPKHGKKQRLIRHVSTLDADYVIIDLGAGTSFNTLDFFLAADRGIVVMLPEPTSIENAYRFIKAAFFRKLQMLEGKHGIKEWVAEAVAGRPGAPQTPWEIIARLRERDSVAASALELDLAGFRPWLVVNQARSRSDYDVGTTVSAAWKKFFGLDLGYLGAVTYDDEVWKSIRTRRPVMVDRPQSAAATGLLRITENLLALDR